MTSAEQGEAFSSEMHAHIERFRMEYDMKLSDITAALGLIIFDLCQEGETLNDFERQGTDDEEENDE
jgi:hypothetical protein